MVVAVLYGIISPFIYSSTLPFFHQIPSFTYTLCTQKEKENHSTISYTCYFNEELVVSGLLMKKGSNDRFSPIYRQTRIVLSARFT